ncbi:PQQ-dependent sugar dehydrogenase [Sphingomonas sp.]|uniref:PQQ-dependent sugar dehydrogenase n=1 Tax=Sphingomonas sp. TaxID=28214 RepID=UPI003B00D9F4
MRHVHRPLAAALLLSATACGSHAKLDVAAGQGLNPVLPAEVHSPLPTVKIADNIGWGTGQAPTPAAGLQVVAFARGLDHPRWLLVLPNGDTLVAETNAPPKPDDTSGIKGFFERIALKKAGGASPSPNRITLLRDTDGDGVSDQRSVFLQGLNSPFGMALVGGTLYVADTDALLAFPYETGATRIAAPPRKVTDLPGGRINHHWTKNVIASPDGSRLYVTVGSNSNVDEKGIAVEQARAAIWEVDPRTGAHRIFAGGLRNPNGMVFEPRSGALWTVVNERDELGSDLVPDYLTSVRPGGFYGWPWRYYGSRVDARVKDPAPPEAARSISPDYALGPHTASLGLASAAGAKLGGGFSNGVFVGQHGSWNRNPPSGYKVIFVPFANGRPTGAKPIDVLGGFLGDGGKAHGRPVGVAVDRGGGLLVADDAGNAVWRVTAAATVKVATR